MTRRRMATRLALIVALAGLAPILIVGIISVEVLRRHSESTARAALRSVAEQAAARVAGYVAGEKEALRAIAAAVAADPDADRRLEEVVLDAPALGRVRLVGPEACGDDLPPMLHPEQVAAARGGAEVSSPVYLAKDLTPALDYCVPARATPGHAVCAQLDMLELWRFVQRIRIGESGYALAFDPSGRILASGAGALRAAILTGESVPQSGAAIAAARDLAAAPGRYPGPGGQEVLAGWARIADPAWTVVVEQPVREALRGARTAQMGLLVFAVLALGMSLGVGVWQSQRMLAELEVEERWKTAGRIAAGITHDLGHRVAILQQTAGLAETGDPSFMPRIGENLKSEVATLRKFVADFADLSRDVRAIQLLPLDLDAFAESIARSAAPHAERSAITIAVAKSAGGAWLRADRYLLERAGLNLLSNAVEASPRGSEVRVVVERAGDAVSLSVVDRGHGIEADRLDRLFDAFLSTKRTGAHVGMGLANVKRIVEAHAGTVTVESTLGEGSTFRLTFPAIAPPEGYSSSSPAGVSP